MSNQLITTPDAIASSRLQELAAEQPRDIDIQYAYFNCFGELSQSFQEELLDHELIELVKTSEYSESFIDSCKEIDDIW